MKKTWTSASDISKKLEPFRELIKSGMTDAQVAVRSHISVRTIQRWRLKEGLKKSTAATKKLETVKAVSAFGETLGDVRQRAAHSPVLGAWEAPAFVVREHLDYDNFLKVLDAAYRILGMSEDEIAKGLGLTQVSVAQGIEIYNNHRKNGKRCLHCGDLIDPNRVSVFCTTFCERVHVNR